MYINTYMHTYAEERVRAPEDDANKLKHDEEICVYIYVCMHIYM